MRFLIVVTSKHLAPPEVASMLIDGTFGWLDRYRGKMEQVWGFAGTQGGGGVANVESFEELDQIMAEFPPAAFSNVDIYPLTDLPASLNRAKAAMAAMMPPQ